MYLILDVLQFNDVKDGSMFALFLQAFCAAFACGTVKSDKLGEGRCLIGLMHMLYKVMLECVVRLIGLGQHESEEVMMSG